MRKFVALTLLFCGFSLAVCAQFYPTQYRPPNQHWQYLKTPHLKLLYARGNDSTALRMGQILESQYAKTQLLVGGNLSDFPIILNNYNDRSNGFVSPLHFRSEIELPPIKGKSLNPQTGNWLTNVGPHELTHALQFSNLGGFNIPKIVSLFSPDLARSFHGAIPSGITEGIAVHHETDNIVPNGGRGNYPFFTNQYNAIFNSDQRWSMGQHVQHTTYTRPFNRHYIGGYTFTSWIQEEFGPQTTRKAIDFYMDWPFLGYGWALHNATGLWPTQLYERFEDDKKTEISKTNVSQQFITPDIPFKGRNIRRAKWLSDSTLIFYGSFYNARPGFYSYNLNTSKINRILTTNSISDYRYDLSTDRSELIYSYYQADPIYDNTAKAELVRVQLDSHIKTQITDDGRLYAPVFYKDQLLALGTKPASSQLVSVQNKNKQQDSLQINTLSVPKTGEIKAVAVSPVNDKLAVVINKQGKQGLWISDLSNLSDELSQNPTISFSSGSVFDPEWHPKEKKLLFSSDFSGILQLYEYNLATNTVIQITNVAYNAFEGSYNPSGNRIAFIRQEKNEQLPAIINRSNVDGNYIPNNIWQTEISNTIQKQQSVTTDSIITQSKQWESGQYKSGLGWIKPRTVLPVFNEVSNQDVYEWGLSLHSNNLLANQSYSAEYTYFENRSWFNVLYQNKTFYPGFKARIFSEPTYFLLLSQNNLSTFSLLQQERGVALSIPFQLRLNQNITNTSLFIEPEIRQSQFRFFDVQSNNRSSDFFNSTVANIFTQFNYRLQQNLRDLQPNSGALFYTEVEHNFNSDDPNFSGQSNNIPIRFLESTALSGGVYTFLSPFRRWNQSLRLGIEGVTQSGLIFNNQSIVSGGFSEAVFPGASNLLSFSTRYTIPLAYVDNGGFLFPLYLSNIYIVTFTNTITDPTITNIKKGSRNMFGIGLRGRFRISNLTFDIGVGFGYEPSRDNINFFVGDF
ncbi:hypothetical protein LX73_1411 [Fodinibius salinus]|uniref:WD40-like Beta Propeller Repeat n=2 Tax=Fodinibius salinus TaxID=860790 RepID=A0A5D3YLZ5_9BACT|nr:hypothetical protein LX73_1411 [Fodinibius salinus]